MRLENIYENNKLVILIRKLYFLRNWPHFIQLELHLSNTLQKNSTRLLEMYLLIFLAMIKQITYHKIIYDRKILSLAVLIAISKCRNQLNLSIHTCREISALVFLSYYLF